MKPTIERSQVVVCDGQRPMGMICPRDGAYEAQRADGCYLGKHPTVQAARRAILDADKAVRG